MGKVNLVVRQRHVSIISVIACVLLVGCKKAGVEMPSEPLPTTDYWPLEAGNSWTYSWLFDSRDVFGTKSFTGVAQWKVTSNATTSDGTVHYISATFNGQAVNRNYPPGGTDSVQVRDQVISFSLVEVKESTLIQALDTPSDPFGISSFLSWLSWLKIRRFHEAATQDTIRFVYTNGVSACTADFEKQNGMILWESIAGNNTYWRVRAYLTSR